MAILAIQPIVLPTLGLALALAVGAFLFWLVTRLRDGEVDDTREANDSLAKFRELHARGGLSDEEYRTIKTQLASRLEQELGNSARSSQSDASGEQRLDGKAPQHDFNALGDASKLTDWAGFAANQESTPPQSGDDR